MRRPELTKEQLRDMIRDETRRLPALKQAIAEAKKTNDLEAYLQAKLWLDDCLEEIKHLQGKLNPYGGTELIGGCPDCGGAMSYGQAQVYCLVCGGDGNPTKRIGAS